jgi:hypothetical protein
VNIKDSIVQAKVACRDPLPAHAACFASTTTN